MKKSRLLGALCAVLLSAIPYGAAHAISIRLEFAVSEFGLGTAGNVAPQDMVSGIFTYEAASINSTIDALTGVNLEIAGHAYSLDDVDFASTGTGLVFQCIGEDPAAGCNIGGAGRDFVLEWTPHNLQPTQFAYSVESDVNEYWATSAFDNFSITAVPIPPALLLFGSGLVGLAGIARRKKAT